MSRMIVLAGAPEASSLEWSDKGVSSMHIESRTSSPSKQPLSPTERPFSAQWRQLNTDSLQMRPILPKLDIAPRPQINSDGMPTEFLMPSELSSQDALTNESSETDSSHPSDGSGSMVSTSEELSEFYDHSFTIHEAKPTSQLSEISVVTPGTPTYESTDEKLSMTPMPVGGIIRSSSQRRLSQAPRPKHLADLDTLPNCNYLQSIEPQTMTVNIIVGILSIAPSRKIMTGARYGRPRPTELVEMMVGDDTKTGFSITMWLPQEMRVNWKDGANAAPEGSRSHLRRALKELRPRDVVLIQNVALSHYRGKVHGQSLRGDVTKIDLLFRKKVDDNDLNGVYSVSNLRTATGRDAQVLKVRKVRDWLVEFVGDGQAKGRGKKSGRRELPNDTQ